MKCKHCCFACTNRGHDMPKETFQRSIALAAKYYQLVTIGGGEPTLHPLFNEYMQYSMWEMAGINNDFDLPPVGVITNGTSTKVALKIAQLAKVGVIWAGLSKDGYHDSSMVDDEVFDAFERKYGGTNDHRSIYRSNGELIAAGRAKSWGSRQECVCSSLFITPQGNIFACGCKTKKLGNVNNPESLQLTEYDFRDICPKYQREEYLERD